MATTTVSYDGDGAQVDFTITYAYTDQTFVEVRVGDVLKTKGTHYNFFSSTVIRFTGGNTPPNGTNNVELRRNTGTTPLVDWSSGASLPEADLDKADLQLLHIVEELENDFSVGLGKTGGNWDGQNLRMTNVAAPISDSDVATKASIAAQVTAAETAETNAETAETNAETAETNSETAETNAQTSETNAAASAATISSVFPVSGLTTGNMLVVNGAASYIARRIPHYEFVSSGSFGGTTQDIALAAGPDKYLLSIKGLQGNVGNDELLARVSIDSGSSYKSGSAEYSWYSRSATSNGANATASTSDSEIRLLNSLSDELPLRLEIDIYPGNGTIPGHLRLEGSAHDGTRHDPYLVDGVGGWNNSSAPHLFTTRWTNIRLLFKGASTFGAGTYTLYKWIE